MNFTEFQAGVQQVRKLIVGSQLQDFSIQGRDLVLLFYKGKPTALRISLSTPPVLFFELENFKLDGDSQKLPMALFLSRHFLRKVISEVKSRDEWGRRFEIVFHSEGDTPYYMQIVLVPGFQNVGLFAEDKKIYWLKPKSLSESVIETKNDVVEFRSLDKIREEWYGKMNTSMTNPTEKDWKIEVQKKIKKKTEAIEKILQQSEENEKSVRRLYEVGELLKYKSIDELNDDDKNWIRVKESRDWNREQIFKKAKAMSTKKAGMASRIQVLTDEISKLIKSLEGPAPEVKHNISIAGKARVDTRKLEIDKTLSLYMGKNAKDNVQLLKSSQPWELWFHLKDFPSAYAITRRNKGVPIGHTELIKMAAWFAKECFKNNKEKSPTHIEVVYTECRYVKLLKGDRLGRVSYTNGIILRVSTS